MSLIEALQAQAPKDTSVTAKIGGKNQVVRLRPPTYDKVLAWGEASAQLDKKLQEGNMSPSVSTLEQAVLVLRGTMVEDNEQPTMTDAQLAQLIEHAGGLVKPESSAVKLTTAARDLMWAAAGFDGALDALPIDEGAEKTELPLESQEDTA